MFEDKLNQLLEAIRQHAELEDEQIIEAATHGADCGFPGFTYNHEASEFFDQHDELIWEHLSQYAEEMGERSPVSLIASFGRADMAETFQGLKVLLAWFALEEVGHYLTRLREEG